MSADLNAELIESFLTAARAAAVRREWPTVLDLAGDVLVLDSDNGAALTLRTLAEQHVGRGQPSWGRRQETVLFADLVSSTELATRFDPEYVRTLIRDYELACTPAITALGGHMHRFVGDGILASFGYPTSHEDDARRAVEAGLDLVAAVVETSRKYERVGVQLAVRVGIASGVLVHADRGVGNWVQGGDLFGEAVNLAARLHDVAAPNEICLSAETASLVVGFFLLERLEDRQLKGFDAPVAVHRVVARTAATGWVDRMGDRLAPFVNRDNERERLNAAWASVAGSPSGGESAGSGALFVAGDPGVGKSRLLREFIHAWRSAERTVVEMQCSAYWSSTPLRPVRDLLERRCGFAIDDDDATRYAKLTEVVGARFDADAGRALAMLLDLHLAGGVEPLELSATQLREVTLGHLVGWIVEAARRAPTLLVLEDVHWADPSTRELLQRVTALRPPGLLAIVTSRTPPAWVHDAGFDLLTMLPLSHDEARLLAEGVAGDELAPELADEIARRSDGVPLYVEQLAASMARTVPSSPGTHDVIPLPLTELLQARLDTTGASKRVAQLAATVGREFEPAFLAAFVERLQLEGRLEPIDRPVGEHLARLVDSHIVEPDPIDDRLLRFRHALVGEAAYDSQLLAERPERHEVLARLLLDQGDDGWRGSDPTVVALHFERAGLAVEAIGQYLVAAARNQAVGAFAEVTASMDRAETLLAMTPEPLRPGLELGIRMSRGLAVSSASGYAAQAVIDDFGRAVELCDELREVTFFGQGVLHALLGLWMYYCATAQLATATSISDTLEQQLERVQMRAGWPSFHACRGVERFYTGDLDEADERLELAIELLADDDIDVSEWPLPHCPLAAVLAFVGPLRLIRGDERGALEAIDAGVERCGTLAFPIGPFSRAFVGVYEGWVHRMRGDLVAARQAAEEVVRIGEQHGFFDWLATGRIHLAAVRAAEEPSVAALGELGEAITTWRAVGGKVALPSLIAEQAFGYLVIGERQRAASCLADAEDLSGGVQGLAVPELGRLRAELVAMTNGVDDPRVAAELAGAMRTAVGQGAHLHVLRCGATHERLLGTGALEEDLRQAFKTARAKFGERADVFARSGSGEHA
jgi:class 3 adenylate cyclase